MRLAPVHVLAAVTLLASAGCATNTGALPPMNTGGPYPPVAMQCDAERARWAVGRAATEDVVEEVRAATTSQAVRVIHPGQMVTMDHRGDRVNIHVNERNAITSVTCG